VGSGSPRLTSGRGPELADDGDILRLQYLNEVEPDLESVRLPTDFGRELFANVVAAMRGDHSFGIAADPGAFRVAFRSR
jgi:hypothetical protein